jgi:hypothetical protein
LAALAAQVLEERLAVLFFVPPLAEQVLQEVEL